MSEFIDKIAATLKTARAAKGLSQRALAERAGVPQSHISKIESGGVDLRVSSLVELSRALDLEVTLVPRKTVPAVKSIVHNISSTGSMQFKTNATLSDVVQSTVREFKRLRKTLDATLTEHPGIKELAQMQRQVREFEQLSSVLSEPGAFREVRAATRAVQSFKERYQSTNHNSAINQLRQVISEFDALRNLTTHSVPEIERPKPAYSLEEDDDG